jgi:hypothetical protein
MRPLLLLGLLATIGCSSSFVQDSEENKSSLPASFCDKIPVSLYVDESFSVSQKLSIYDAINEWSVRTGDTMEIDIQTVDIKPEDMVFRLGVILIIPEDKASDTDRINESDILGITYRGQTDGNTGSDRIAAKIVIRTDMKDCLFLPVIIHEIGHSFKLVHSPDIHDVMHLGAYCGMDISHNDLLAWDKIWNCNPN